MGPVTYVVLGVIVIGAIVFVVRRKRAKKTETAGDTDSREVSTAAASDEGCGT